LIYNGALTYYPNFDAVKFFMTDIFPLILETKPETKLIVTGKTDGVSIDQIPNKEHIIFTGYVDDIRPVVAKSQICVVPLRQGAGTRLKILEAMALGTAVISTIKGAEGLEVTNNEHIILADSPDDFARAVIQLLNDPNTRKNLEQNANALIKKVYDWKIIENKFSDHLLFFESDRNKV
jgi:glycosyltransferase involved in cell wall biosynthesis